VAVVAGESSGRVLGRRLRRLSKHLRKTAKHPRAVEAASAETVAGANAVTEAAASAVAVTALRVADDQRLTSLI